MQRDALAAEQHSRGTLALCLHASMSTIPTIKREIQQEATGTTVAPTPADHRPS